jgi:hypothetical protein
MDHEAIINFNFIFLLLYFLYLFIYLFIYQLAYRTIWLCVIKASYLFCFLTKKIRPHHTLKAHTPKLFQNLSVIRGTSALC